VGEMELIESQLNDKDAEITTVKSYFEKIQNENEKLLKDIDTMKRELTHHKSN
jgi:peptidoglycan hydrolase CwlO-like protein